MQGGIDEETTIEGPLSGGVGPGADGSGTGGQAPMTDPVMPVNVDGPCDIYAAAGQECVAAYSTVRRLLSTYTGPLYQIRVGSSPFNIGGLVVTNPAQAQLPNPMQGGARIPYTTAPEPGELVDIPQMGDIAQAMLRDALESFVKRDTRLARQVLNEDDRLDGLKTQVFRELLTVMLNDPATVEPAIDLILVSRHLERTGDHATNIAEDVIFMVSALDVRHHPPAEPTH